MTVGRDGDEGIVIAGSVAEFHHHVILLRLIGPRDDLEAGQLVAVAGITGQVAPAVGAVVKINIKIRNVGIALADAQLGGTGEPPGHGNGVIVVPKHEVRGAVDVITNEVGPAVGAQALAGLEAGFGVDGGNLQRPALAADSARIAGPRPRLCLLGRQYVALRLSVRVFGLVQLSTVISRMLGDVGTDNAVLQRVRFGQAPTPGVATHNRINCICYTCRSVARCSIAAADGMGEGGPVVGVAFRGGILLILLSLCFGGCMYFGICFCCQDGQRAQEAPVSDHGCTSSYLKRLALIVVQSLWLDRVERGRNEQSNDRREQRQNNKA